jgi:hypothetical protein
MDKTTRSMAMCADGKMHLFEICDDGADLNIAVCGSESAVVATGDENSIMCSKCLQEMAEWACPEDPKHFIRLVEEGGLDAVMGDPE